MKLNKDDVIAENILNGRDIQLFFQGSDDNTVRLWLWLDYTFVRLYRDVFDDGDNLLKEESSEAAVVITGLDGWLSQNGYHDLKLLNVRSGENDDITETVINALRRK